MTTVIKKLCLLKHITWDKKQLIEVASRLRNYYQKTFIENIFICMYNIMLQNLKLHILWFYQKNVLSEYSPKAKYKGVDWVANILDDSRYGTWIWQWSFGSRSSNCTFVLTSTLVANLIKVTTSSKQSRSTRLCFQEKRYIIPAVKLMAMRFFRYC